MEIPRSVPWCVALAPNVFGQCAVHRENTGLSPTIRGDILSLRWGADAVLSAIAAKPYAPRPPYKTPWDRPAWWDRPVFWESR